MFSDFGDLHDIADTVAEKNGGKRANGWPKMPSHDASITTIREYLTRAANLPDGWVVDKAERHGRYAVDALTITIRTPGPADNIEVRFDAQRDCSKAGALRGAVSEATNGMSRMKYPKPAEASDFYVMVCALAEVATTTTMAEETLAWLYEYLERGWVMEHMTLIPDHRYDALVALQARPEFDRIQAGAYLSGNLEEHHRWVVIPDSQTDELWIRVGEFAAYMRHVHGGVGSISQPSLDARVREASGARVKLEENRRARGGKHLTLNFYRFPSVQAFPSVIRMHDPS